VVVRKSSFVRNFRFRLILSAEDTSSELWLLVSENSEWSETLCADATGLTGLYTTKSMPYLLRSTSAQLNAGPQVSRNWKGQTHFLQAGTSSFSISLVIALYMAW
jgi:hypothetical protein